MQTNIFEGHLQIQDYLFIIIELYFFVLSIFSFLSCAILVFELFDHTSYVMSSEENKVFNGNSVSVGMRKNFGFLLPSK